MGSEMCIRDRSIHSIRPSIISDNKLIVVGSTGPSNLNGQPCSLYRNRTAIGVTTFYHWSNPDHSIGDIYYTILHLDAGSQILYTLSVVELDVACCFIGHLYGNIFD